MWECFITNEMLEEIVLQTNQILISIRANYANSDRQELKDTDIVELRAFIDLLLYSIFKSNHEDLTSIFATDGTGRDTFRSTMSLKRFQLLLVAHRFDDLDTKAEHSKTDRLAPILHIFHTFVQNCKNNYSIREYTCIDEMLVSFRGKCHFRVYMPNKPGKYGIKILILNDSRTHYFLNG